LAGDVLDFSRITLGFEAELPASGVLPVTEFDALAEASAAEGATGVFSASPLLRKRRLELRCRSRP
jgi:hypothetical protein